MSLKVAVTKMTYFILFFSIDHGPVPVGLEMHPPLKMMKILRVSKQKNVLENPKFYLKS